MKTDKQFIESIYSKRNAHKAAVVKKRAFALGVSMVLVLVVCAVAFMPFSEKTPRAQGALPESDIAALPETSDTEIDIPSSEQNKGDTVVAYPAGDKKTDEGKCTYLTPTFALTGPMEGQDSFYNALEDSKNSETRFGVSLTLKQLSGFTYEGRTISEIFKKEIGYRDYQFNDDDHKEYNDFIKGFTAWEVDGYREIFRELADRANAGDREAEAILQEHCDNGTKTLYYETVWSVDKSPETIAAFQEQKAEYDTIWAEYGKSGVEVLETTYKEELERLIGEGYDLTCTTVDGELMLLGMLTADQILYFNEHEGFEYRCTWIRPAEYESIDGDVYGEKVYVFYTDTEENSEDE